MTQLVFDEEWLVPAPLNYCRFDPIPKPRTIGHIRLPWVVRYDDAYDKWWDSGAPNGEEPEFEDFIPRMTEEIQQ